MTIGSPSGSGATQNDIADGADESDGRWRTIYDSALVGGADTEIQTGGSGAAPVFESGGVQMSSFTDGDWGYLSVGSAQPADTSVERGTALIKARCGFSQSIGNLISYHQIGQIGTVKDADSKTDHAMFRPHVGDSTPGNVRVSDGAATTDGSVAYPPTDEIHNYTVLIDRAGHFLDPGHTGFYIDGDPRAGDAPNADLAVVPGGSGDDVWGLHHRVDGDREPFGANHLEVAIRP